MKKLTVPKLRVLVSILPFLTLLHLTNCSWSQKSLFGGWEGQLTPTNVFDFTVTLNMEDEENHHLLLQGKTSTTKIELQQKSSQLLYGAYQDQLIAKIDTKTEKPMVFLQVGHHLCAVELQQETSTIWKGNWQLLITENVAATLLISFAENEDGSVYASIFFEEPTLHYLFADEFKHSGPKFSFVDIRSRIRFEGILQNDIIGLKMNFLQETVALNLRRSPVSNWQLGLVKQTEPPFSKEVVSNPVFDQLVQDVKSDSLERTHAIVVAQQGEVIFEHYFDGFAENSIHDTRSLAKSFAAAIVGIAIEENLLKDENLTIQPFFDQKYPTIDWSNGKDSITLFDLMTMSSGIDAIDFGLNRISYANEGNYQSQADWTKHILEAPMVYKPGTAGNYGSGSPHLLGPILASRLSEDLEFYLHRKLFAPLGINNYRIQITNQSIPYFGGGWYFQPNDLIKFGQLYLDEGRYNGQQVIPKDWIEKSMAKHTVLANTFDKNEYGFLLWHKTYLINNLPVQSIEARGSGGQYLFIIPQLEMVAVITSGNYTNNKGFQPERIMAEYLLPQLMNSK